jgi:hypothetical protein
MVNHRDPDVVAQDSCAYAFAAKHANPESQLTSFYRDNVEDLACRGRSLLVCVSHNVSQINNNLCFISSWEFFTTLDYEWSVIRGRRRNHGWTIWVCTDARFLLGFIALP